MLIAFVAMLHFKNTPYELVRMHPLPLISYATFTQNFLVAWDNHTGPNWLGPTWSLALEEQFYLLFPFVIRFCSGRKLLWLLLAGIASAPLLRLLIGHWGVSPTLAVYVLAPCRADALLLGVLLAWVWRQPRVMQLLGTESATTAVRAAFMVLLAGAVFLTVKTLRLCHSA
jgi:peptidoglycan/LPS O-acetylase OafA/YrhL